MFLRRQTQHVGFYLLILNIFYIDIAKKLKLFLGLIKIPIFYDFILIFHFHMEEKKERKKVNNSVAYFAKALLHYTKLSIDKYN